MLDIEPVFAELYLYEKVDVVWDIWEGFEIGCRKDKLLLFEIVR